MATATDTSTAGGGAELLKNYYEDVFIERLEANLVFKPLGKRGTVPKNGGKGVYWFKSFNLAAATTAISEGFDPSATQLSTTVISAVLTQYGQPLQLTDVFKDTSAINTMKEVMGVMGYNAAQSIDTLIRNTVVAGSTVQYAGTAVARNSIPADAAFTLDIDELREGRATLEAANAPRFSDGLFAAVVHPTVVYDIQGDSKWVDTARYTDSQVGKLLKGEVGSIYGFKVLSTTQAPVLTNSGSGTADIYQSMLMGPDYFGVSDLYDTQIIIKDPSPQSPLNLYSTVGWKADFAVKRLDESRAVRVESWALLGS